VVLRLLGRARQGEAGGDDGEAQNDPAQVFSPRFRRGFHFNSDGRMRQEDCTGGNQGGNWAWREIIFPVVAEWEDTNV